MSNGNFAKGIELSNAIKKLEEELIIHYRDSELLFVIANFKGAIQFANVAWERLGWTTNQVRTHLTWYGIAHPEDLGLLVQKMTAAFSNPQDKVEFRVRRKEGGYTLVRWSTSKIGDSGLIYAQGEIISLKVE